MNNPYRPFLKKILALLPISLAAVLIIWLVLKLL